MTFWVEIVCDECARTIAGHHLIRTNRIQIRERRAEASAAGWVHIDGEDLCPRCVRKRLENNERKSSAADLRPASSGEEHASERTAGTFDSSHGTEGGRGVGDVVGEHPESD